MSERFHAIIARVIFLTVIGSILWLAVRPGGFGRRWWHQVHPSPMEIPASPNVLALLDEPLEKAHQAGKTPILRFNQESSADGERLQKDVFAQPGWKNYEDQNVVVFDFQFPAKIDPADSEALRQSQLMEAVSSAADEKRRFPMVAVLSRDGQLLGARTGYQAGGVQDYIDWIEKLRQIDDSPIVPTTAPRPVHKPKVKKDTANKKEDKAKTSLVVTNSEKASKPAPTAANTSTNKPLTIMVKGVTGTGDSRVVLIAIGKKNYPFGIGEKRTLAVEDTSLTLHCREITTNAVIVHVNQEEEDRSLPLP